MNGNDKKKYNKIENVLQKINSNFISLNEDEKKTAHPILEHVVYNIIEKMKLENETFKNLFECVYYGGSYYDGLKVGKPEEFDIDLKMSLPKLVETNLEISCAPGFVKVKMPGWAKFEINAESQRFKDLAKLKDAENYLLQNKTLNWIEGIVTKALQNYPYKNGSYQIPYKNSSIIQVSTTKSGPANTLVINLPDKNVKMDVDLVASFKFDKNYWPPKPFRQYSEEYNGKKEFLIVPKKPKGDTNDKVDRLWRLSFQEQEREMMNGKDKFKPALRLLKKFRDTNNQSKISSYFLKTIFLIESENKKNDPDFWKSSLSFIFMHMLKQYANFLEKENIPYFWYKKNNLIGDIDSNTIKIYKNTLIKIINTIDKNFEENPEIITDYIYGQEVQVTGKTFISSTQLPVTTTYSSWNNLIPAIAIGVAGVAGVAATINYLMKNNTKENDTQNNTHNNKDRRTQ